MIRSLHASRRLWMVWVGLLMAFVVFRPAVASPAFWLLALVVVAATALHMSDAYAKALDERQRFARLEMRLLAVGARLDLREGDDVASTLDARQWEIVFAALLQMPMGSRSLRRAVQQSCPGVLN
jgi:hypothetical protein